MKLTWKIWLLIIVLFFSVLSIFNLSALFQKGVLITSVDSNSSAFEQGLRQGQIIIGIDGNSLITDKEIEEVSYNPDLDKLIE